MAAMRIDRREFLRRSATGAVGIGLAHSVLGAGALGAGRAGAGSDTVVVAIFLDGGNDGLNTVVPLSQYGRYRDLRPTLGFDEGDLLPLAGTNDFALNPGLGGIQRLYARGDVAIVNGFGVPETAPGRFDHHDSELEFETANVSTAAAEASATGWLGRYLDTVAEREITPGIDVGRGVPLLAGAIRSPLTVDRIAQSDINLTFNEAACRAAYDRLQSIPATESAVGERIRQARVRGREQFATLRARTSGYEARATYPSFDDNLVAFALYQCAEVITADVGVRAVSAWRTDFDTHAGQSGYHDYLLSDVGDAVEAFHTDLRAHGAGDRVITLVYSEFGRRPEQNNSDGTDHGWGSVCFAIGDAVRGGLYGEFPGIEANQLTADGNLAVTTDFRSVYATLLARHLGGDPEPVLFGDFPLLDFLR